LIEDLNIPYKLKVIEGVMNVQEWDKRIPLDEINQAKQLEIWVDICLKWPNEVKIITIENANALDPNTLARVKEKVEEAGAQAFLETVYHVWENEIVIENGECKEDVNILW
jgi:hypothetical protein